MKNAIKGRMFYIAFVASLGGLLFGFDTAVISGAERAIQDIYELSNFAHGFTIAIALIGFPAEEKRKIPAGCLPGRDFDQYL